MGLPAVCGKLALANDGNTPQMNEMLSFLAGYAEAQERALAIVTHPSAGFAPEFTLQLLKEAEVDIGVAIELLNTLPCAGQSAEARHG